MLKRFASLYYHENIYVFISNTDDALLEEAHDDEIVLLLHYF